MDGSMDGSSEAAVGGSRWTADLPLPLLGVKSIAGMLLPSVVRHSVDACHISGHQ